MITGDNIRLIRNWKKLVQKQAADLLDISQPRYSKLEKKKKINGAMLQKIKMAFRLSDDDIDRIINLPPPRKMSKKTNSQFLSNID